MSVDGQVILIVGHGSPRAEANAGFVSMAERVAGRLGAARVLPAFFSIARPSIEDQVAALAAQGVREISLMPYFLYRGQHVTKDIPVLLEDCRAKYPGVRISVLPTLENEPVLEDVVVERLASLAPLANDLPVDGQAIEERSFQIIDSHLQLCEAGDDATRVVIRRVVHATADFSFARTMRFHPQAIARGVEALRSRRPIICDVKMVQAGLTKISSEVICAIGEPEVARLAGSSGSTRAAAAMKTLAGRLEGSIVVVGNAPTALWSLLELVGAGGARPALVVGLPVGFVGARESKLALMQSDLCYISNTGPRGGSPVAAAVVNALAGLKQEGS